MKPFLPRFSSPALPFFAVPRSGVGRASAWRKIGIFSPPAERCEKGFLLLFLLPSLFLALALLAGTVKVVFLSQQRIAMQSRLDVCAVRLLEARRAASRELVRTNAVLRSTALAIAMARGAILLAGPAGALVGKAGETVLLRLNQGTARWQETRVWFFQGREIFLQRCSPTPFSRQPVLCQMNPSLKKGLQRAPTFFPDVKGPLQFQNTPIARVSCRGFSNLKTKLVLEGDATLTTAQFSDHYEE